MKANQKGNILVIDDDIANLGILFEYLRQANFKVFIAEDGASALKRVERFQPDIILLDVMMPDIDGFELCRQLMESGKITDTPIIFLSVLSEPTNKVRALNLDAVDYITKPFQPEEVVARVEKHVALRNLQKELKEKNAQLYRANSDLRREIVERKQAEEALQVAHDQLEKRVEERTAELLTTNKQLAQEIEERKRVEKALLNGTAKIQAIVDTAVDGVITIEQNGVVESFNKAAEEMFGYRAGEVIGQNLKMLMPSFYHKKYDNYLNRYLTTGVKRIIGADREVVGQRKDGTTFPLEITVSEVSLDNRRLFTGIARDITKRKLNQIKIERRNLELTALNTVTAAVNSSLELPQVFTALKKALAEQLDVPGGAIFFYTDFNDQLAMVASWGLPETLVLKLKSDPENTFYRQRVIWERETIMTQEFQKDALLEWQSYLSIPLVGQGEIEGIVDLFSPVRAMASFSADQIDFFDTLGQQVGIAIHNARLHTEIQRRAKELTTLNKAGQALTSTLELNQVLEQMLVEVNTLLEAETASVLLHNSTSNKLVFVAVATPEFRTLIGTHLPLKAGIAGWVMQEKRSTLIDDAQRDPRFYNHIDTITGLTTRSLITAPLLVKEKAIGVVEVINKVNGVFSQRELEILEALANSAAIAIENARLFEQVQAGHEQLRQLARQVVSAQEDERQRLSRELHDEAGQALTALKIQLELMQATLPAETETIYANLARAVDLTDTTMEQLHMLARDLRPPALDTVGLNPTLEGLCREFARNTQLEVKYKSVQGIESILLPASVNICLYRILQECLTNIAKHAQATQVRVKLNYRAGTVSLSIADDGQGFDPQAVQRTLDKFDNMGILGMQERLELLGGSLEIKSQPGQGARLVARITV